MAGALIKPLIKHTFKQGTEEVLQQGAKQTLKQGAGEVLQQGAEQVVKQAPSTPLAVNLGEALADSPKWNNTPNPMQRVYQQMADAGDGEVIQREFRGFDAGDEDSITALQNRFSGEMINQKVRQAIPAKRSIEAAAEGRVLEAPDEPMMPTVSDDLNYLEKGVDYTDELAQWEKNRARAESGMEKALSKPKPKFSEDLLNRITTIGQIPGQVKKWLKKAEQKWKAGIPFEVGDALTDEMGEFLGSSIEGMTFQELHHELMKAVYSAYVDTAAKLVQSGKGNTMDILNLNHMANSYGFGMGDFGVEAYPRPAHSWGHSELIAEGVQKSGDELKAQVQAITELPNMQALTQDFKRSLEELAIPMRRKLDLGKRAYMQLPEIDRIKVIQLRSTKDNLKNNLKELMVSEFQQADLPIPKGDGQQIFEAFKKAGGQPSQEAIDLDKAVTLTREELIALNEKMKTSIGPIVEKDVELDIEEMEQLIDQQFEGITDADTMTREFALKRGSIREASAKAEQKAIDEAADTTEPYLENRTPEQYERDLELAKRGAKTGYSFHEAPYPYNNL